MPGPLRPVIRVRGGRKLNSVRVMGTEMRTLDESDVAEWVRALNVGFYRGSSVTDQEVALRRPGYDLDRTRGVFEGDRCVATLRSMPRELTVPGGAAVDASAVTNVSVTGTHRRRGLASRMMAADLADAKARGNPVSILIAAEYPIYGRYGFGPATWTAQWEIDLPRAALDHRYPGPAEGRVDLVGPAEVRKAGPELHERVRALTPGAINRTPEFWEVNTGEREFSAGSWKEPYFAVYRDADGRIDGLAAYDIQDQDWPDKLPNVRASVRGLTAATPAAEIALWRFLFSLDWVIQVKSGFRPPDDLLPLLLGDPRAARMASIADFMWLRILDVPAALTARRYAGAATSLVLDVHDRAGFAAGRFLLETDAAGAAVCRPAAGTADADLSLDVADLACLYLGDESALRLAALGRLTEHRPAAAASADTLFRTPRRPWCPDVF